MSVALTRTHIVLLIGGGAILLIAMAASIGYVLGSAPKANTTALYGAYGNGNSGQGVNYSTGDVTPLTSDETSLLLYLTEEEKLAHDVYVTLYEKYGARVFNNISRSETTHQNRMLDLLDARGIDDPRSSSVGVFRDTELQKLYDMLIAQGSQSLTEAYKVGVIIEEKDIADLENDLKTIDSSHADVVDALNILLHGSKNHLQAFNRQLG